MTFFIARKVANYKALLLVPALLGSVACGVSQTSLTGAGATFPAPIYTKWFSVYQPIGNAQINYQPNGSGGGIRAVTEGTVDFGASDMPLTDEQLETFKRKRGFELFLFPTVLGAVVPTYNIPGVKQELIFTPETLSGIFLGEIKKWNDPKIAEANPGADLPPMNIVVIHRSDGSGTTYCWTDYLSKVSSEWKKRVGKNTSVEWPIGLGGKGNDGVAGLISHQQGSIGYVELVYAVKNHLSYGKIRNSSGTAMKADLASVTAAAASAKSIPNDFRISITNPDAADAYPVSTFTWLLVPAKNPDPEKQKVLVGFLEWAVTKGQDLVEGLEYARLPPRVADKERKAIAALR